ncbi:hypothetical protein QTP70_000364 [Hemibagrus guttatus]|uniref:ribonuclease H n=1 Tax=Hemibagrus guttatus TaxID=175788 RepID=A0AAE0RCR7_9TELE|nr:hypothetical protein QTP70_000364 [Hemibagrus guttatus]
MLPPPPPPSPKKALVGCELEEKERFWSELDEVMESIPTGERVVIGADFNGHVGEGNTGDEEVMGKFGVKERNLEGQMVVDFAKRMDMGVVNTYFQKREEHRVTYKSLGRRTQVDYILCRRGNLKEISDCKVVVGESVARQHRMVVCRMTLMVCKKKRSKIEIKKKTKWWKLKKEECCEEFRQKLRQALGGQVMLPDDWETTAEVIRETGRKVLGVASGRRKEDKETWWWNEEVQDSIQWKRLAKKKWDMDRTEENRQEYKELQSRVKREVSKAKQKAYEELYTRLDTREGEKDLYRLARQRDRDGKDVQQKVDKIRKDEVRKALKKMKSGKAVGPDDIPVEVWKCLGEAGVEFLASLFNRVLENLEKAYDRVPREELWYCMRKSGVAENVYAYGVYSCSAFVRSGTDVGREDLARSLRSNSSQRCSMGLSYRVESWSVTEWSLGQLQSGVMVGYRVESWSVTEWSLGLLQSGDMVSYRVESWSLTYGVESWSVTEWSHGQLQSGVMVSYRVESCYRVESWSVTEWSLGLLQSGDMVSYRVESWSLTYGVESWFVTEWSHGQIQSGVMVRYRVESWSVTEWSHGQLQSGVMVSYRVESWSVTEWSHGQLQSGVMSGVMVSYRVVSWLIMKWCDGQLQSGVVVSYRVESCYRVESWSVTEWSRGQLQSGVVVSYRVESWSVTEWSRDLEKAYDRVPREELWYCMRKSGVAEKYVRVVQDMYERSRTVVRCAVGQTEEFKVEVGLHQGSALSPFLFAIVMDQLSEEVRQESPWTMMFADDIVICSESREQVEENLERWRFVLERRGMKVSRSKTEYMCVNERDGSGTVRLQGEEVKKVQEFNYLGSIVQSNGECGKEVKKRVQAGWNGWRKVSGVLCDQKISARIKGKVYRTVVRAAMLYGLETVSLRKRQESELEVAELKMLRFSLGVTRLDRIRNEYIRGTAHVGRLGDKVREARLRWFGHVQRRENEVMESIPTGERVVIGADFNGHVGEGNTGDEEVMGKFGVKERNLEGQMVVDFAKRMDMGVVNTYFQKREEHRVTYKSGVVSIYQKWSKEGTVVNRRQGHGRPRLIDARGERRLARVIRSNR